ncbi:tetratricopeptide repeat protein [Komagataeibacter melaceti]|uniref:Tetratricopeptide repeat protein n=1 Tax=Komagataeibacter melaceti TaxID=2766577 RepID=A0A371Z4V6_9PROT|nr:tetratricopeptide repeat-containing glycosyltransferase family protein [Komagataeibacter melaceti]RFD21524.1 tetratricopeptide repeat protein [Komagataeibacter melaceti]
MAHAALPPTSPPARDHAQPAGSGEALQLAGRLEEAAEAYRAALAHTPDDARTLSNYAGVMTALGHFEQAYELVSRALVLDPTLTDGWCNLGNALLQLQRYDDAIAAYRKCLERNPEHALAISNMGVALDRRGEHELAWKFHAAASRLTPENEQTRTNYALSLLAAGDYLNGFREYEWRWTTHSSNAYGMDVPQWKGENFEGRTLLIHTEGGFGDMIQFARFIPQAAARGGRTIVRVRRPLLALLGRSFPEQTFITEDDPIPPHDLQCPVLSLPFALGTTVATIPGAAGYLVPDPEKVAWWRERVAADQPVAKGGRRPLRIGLVWAGAPHPEVRAAEQANRRRSTTLDTFAPLGRVVSGSVFYSLQVGPDGVQARTPPAGMKLIDHTDLLHDFSDTAALICALDLVVAVDTSTAHVAAGLGRPVWMLSRYDQCWRWITGRTDSPWYDSLRIYRQDRPLDWSGPIRRIRAALKVFARAQRAGGA